MIKNGTLLSVFLLVGADVLIGMDPKYVDPRSQRYNEHQRQRIECQRQIFHPILPTDAPKTKRLSKQEKSNKIFQQMKILHARL